MVDIVFYPFAIGLSGIVLILAIDTLVRSRLAWRCAVSGGVSCLVHVSFLYAAWRLWADAAPSGALNLSVSNGAISSALQVNLAGIYIFSIAVTLGLLASFYSIWYMANYRNAALFHSLLILLTVSIYGIVMSGDMLTLFIFWESMSICGYGLVAFRKNSWEALEASIKYLLLAGVGSLIALFGIAVIYSTTGTLSLESLSGLVLTPSPAIVFGLGLIITGFGVEAAIAPLHTWLPDAHPAAPSPMSALLSGIVIETGSFTLIRIIATSFYSQSLVGILQPVFVGFAVVTMLIGNLSAYFQDDLKRLLAFSSIAQVGYILLGISTFTIGGVSASIFQIWNHALLKGLFFLLAGIVTFAFGTRSLTEMAGVGRKWPLLGFLLSLNALAMTGVPPFGMFWSEFLIILSTLDAKNIIMSGAAVLMLLNIAFSIGYYFRIIRRISFDRESEYLTNATRKPRSWLLVVPCLVLVALSLITGFFPDLFYGPASQAVQAMVRH
jgi:multicomponent Na+:H+ antiporter subunit D